MSFNPAELVEELKQLSSSLTFWFWSGKIFAQKPKHLKEEKYSDLKNRLHAKNLPLSLNVLLFGGPGTGKTESVLQLAKRHLNLMVNF